MSNVDKHTLDGEVPVRLCNYVDVYRNDKILSGHAFMTATATPAEVEKFRIRIGDVIITKDSEDWRDIAVPALVLVEGDDLLCGYHLAILRPDPGRVLGAYLFRCLQVPEVGAQLHVAARGVTRFGLTQGDIRNVVVPVPPIAEQAVIVKFLDHADRRIRRYIRAKQRLIKLLEEQKHCIVRDTIHDVRDRSVWVPLSRLVRLVKRTGYPQKPLLSVFREYGVIPKGERANHNADVHDLSLCQLVQPGDIVVNKMKAWQGSVAASGYEGIVSPDYMVLQLTRDNLWPWYFHYLLRSPSIVSEFRRVSNGVRPGQWRLMFPELRQIRVPVPTLELQHRVAEEVERHLTMNESVRSHARREIALLKEYRTRLIADVVTGQLDVREAATNLPDLPPEHTDDPADANSDEDADPTDPDPDEPEED